MDDEEQRHVPVPVNDPPVLGYANPADEEPPPDPLRRLGVIQLVAVGWFAAMVVAGVSADRVRIPLPKKIVLTAGACAIAAALFMRRTDARPGCAVWFVLGAFCFLGVMWFWN